MKHAKNFQDLTGKKIHRITFLYFVRTEENGCATWRVRCECGTEFNALACNVKSGNTKSCGCLRIEKLKARHKTKNK